MIMDGLYLALICPEKENLVGGWGGGALTFVLTFRYTPVLGGRCERLPGRTVIRHPKGRDIMIRHSKGRDIARHLKTRDII